MPTHDQERGGEKEEAEDGGRGLRQFQVSVFFRYLSAFKTYAMKNAPQFGFSWFCFLSFGAFTSQPPPGHFEHVAPKKFIKYNDTQHLFCWPMLKHADS